MRNKFLIAHDTPPFTHAYTLIELLVAVMVIVIMVGIVISTYSFSRKSDALAADTDRFASALRNTRNRAFNRVAFASSSFTCSLGSCSGSGAICTTGADCPSAQTCDHVACSDTITDCLPIDRGHCSNTHYPAGGYGVHVTTDAVGEAIYTIFADVSDLGVQPPYFDDATNETVEAFSVSSSSDITRAGTAINNFEVVFHDDSFTVYENNGGWNEYTPGVAYVMRLEHVANCAAIGKRGAVTLDTATMKITSLLEDC